MERAEIIKDSEERDENFEEKRTEQQRRRRGEMVGEKITARRTAREESKGAETCDVFLEINETYLTFKFGVGVVTATSSDIPNVTRHVKR